MIKSVLVLMTILSITSQKTCEPTYYNSIDGNRHLYEITPSIEESYLYCVYHNEIETVNRLIPNIKDVEEYNTITHQERIKLTELDGEVMAFAHKLGDVEETEFTLKVSVDGEEYVYFVIPKR